VKLRRIAGGQIVFWCPGCKDRHVIDATWRITGPDDKPTVSPSVLVTSGHYLSRHKPGDQCWCTWAERHPEQPAPFKCRRCHLFVRDGQLVLLSDCTHELAGQTVPMQDLPPDA
jgi:hypothetical protein